MREPSDVVAVEGDDWAAATQLIEEIWAAADGGWVNIIPDVGEEVDEPPSLVRAFSVRGPAIPVITLVAPDQRGRKPKPGSVGLEHGKGERQMGELARAGLTRPAGWLMRQDHPRRGLVFEVADEVTVEQALTYAVRAATWLSPSPPRGRWLVALHRRPPR